VIPVLPYGSLEQRRRPRIVAAWVAVVAIVGGTLVLVALVIGNAQRRARQERLMMELTAASDSAARIAAATQNATQPANP
jgi:predicted PurR-regulated permease PerM